MEELRQALYDSIVEHDFDLTNDEVVQVSQRLDKELNRHEKRLYFR